MCAMDSECEAMFIQLLNDNQGYYSQTEAKEVTKYPNEVSTDVRLLIIQCLKYVFESMNIVIVHGAVSLSIEMSKHLEVESDDTHLLTICAVSVVLLHEMHIGICRDQTYLEFLLIDTIYCIARTQIPSVTSSSSSTPTQHTLFIKTARSAYRSSETYREQKNAPKP